MILFLKMKVVSTLQLVSNSQEMGLLRCMSWMWNLLS